MKEQDNSTLFDIIKENPNMTYNEATKVLEGIRLKKELKNYKSDLLKL